MDSLSWIRSSLADRRIGIVSDATGLHPNTIAAIRDGNNKNPKLETLERLAAYLKGQGE